MRISDWSSDVCSSDLVASVILDRWVRGERRHIWISKNEALLEDACRDWSALGGLPIDVQPLGQWKLGVPIGMREGILFVTYPTLRSGRSDATRLQQILEWRSEEHTSELQSLMRISYAVFCLKTTNNIHLNHNFNF